jgi:hypothetical protein
MAGIKREHSEEAPAGTFQLPAKKAKAAFITPVDPEQFVFVVESQEYPEYPYAGIPHWGTSHHNFYGIYASLTDANKALAHHLKRSISVNEGVLGKKWEDLPGGLRKRMEKKMDEYLAGSDDVNFYLENHDLLPGGTIADLEGSQVGSTWCLEVSRARKNASCKILERCVITVRKVHKGWNPED